MARECILFFLVCLFSVTGVSCLTCEKCIPEECVSPVNCTGGTVADPCRCCMECAKVEGESCGGLHGTLGECDKGLSCNREVKHGEAVSDVDSKDGICHLERSGSCFGCNIKNDERCYCSNTGCSENNPVAFKYKDYNSCKRALEEGVTPAYGLNCSQVMCTPVPQMLCPPDSEVIETQRADADSCCPKPGRCICRECRPAMCDKPGWQEVIVRRGNSSTPGSCCDLYECKYKDEECQLPMTNCSAPDCPDDSVLVSHPAERVFTPCCTKSISCKCDQSKCTQLRCPAGQEPIGDRKPATNVPGSCCDKLDCKKVVLKYDTEASTVENLATTLIDGSQSTHEPGKASNNNKWIIIGVVLSAFVVCAIGFVICWLKKRHSSTKKHGGAAAAENGNCMELKSQPLLSNGEVP